MPVDVPPAQFEPVDSGYRERVRASFAMQSAMATFGISIAEIGPGWVNFAVKPPVGLTQQDGFLHAGVVATALDSACGYAAFTLMPSDARVLTSGYKIDLLRPAEGADFVARGWVVKPGRTLTVASGELTRSDGKVAAVMTGTLVAVSAAT